MIHDDDWEESEGINKILIIVRKREWFDPEVALAELSYDSELIGMILKFLETKNVYLA